MAQLPDGALMQRAAHGLALECVRILKDEREKVAGARVVLLIGSGDNGGDALFAGAELAARGVSVVAITLADKWHTDGAAALRAASGRLEQAESQRHINAIIEADLVLDGIVGIGGKGALRSPADQLAAAASASDAHVVAVDLPSGVDADTGAVADGSAVISADTTVTFGCVKPGLLVPPASSYVGELIFVDIGLTPELPPDPALALIEPSDAANWISAPGDLDDKYTRGVVGVVAGSKPYPGAAVLCTGSARLGGAGMVRYAGSAATGVIAAWPEVVSHGDGPGEAGRVQAWVVGPGGGTDVAAIDRIEEALEVEGPVLLDADALTVLASEASVRERVKARHESGAITVITPHAGEFARLGYKLGEGADADRVAAVVGAAADLGAVVLLKGTRTVVAAPDGTAYVNAASNPALATAGSGDVLSGLLGSMLAHNWASHGSEAASEIAASAALIHGVAGQIAAADDRPVTAMSILTALPEAIASVRAAAE